jgi:hypothetical protein
MDVNDNAYFLNERAALESIASKLAPTLDFLNWLTLGLAPSPQDLRQFLPIISFPQLFSPAFKPFPFSVF